MPPAQMDALGAFSYLSDSLPTWISQLSELTAHTSAKHAEFADAFKKHSTAPLKPRRRKNSSVCSIQTNSIRRRKAAAAAGDDDNVSSSDSDAPAVISTRHSLIIHYDGHTQKTLEEMVRDIGTARNNLRRGKMARLPRPGAGARPPPPRSAARAMLPTLEEPEDLLASIRSSRARGPPQPQPQPEAPPTAMRKSPFDAADKNLEVAHSFCETAAYQFLRAGACASELDSVKERFTALLKMVTEEVELLKEEKKKEEEEAAKQEPEVEAETEAESPAKEITPEPLLSLKRPASNEGAIEVDDEQGSVESIDLTTFRVGRMRR